MKQLIGMSERQSKITREKYVLISPDGNDVRELNRNGYSAGLILKKRGWTVWKVTETWEKIDERKHD